MPEQILVVLILVTAIVLFLTEKIPPDLVALGVMIALGLTGVLTVSETISGFGRSTVITLISMSILVEALRQAGWTEKAAAGMMRIIGKNPTLKRIVLISMVFGVFLALVMNNISVASVLLPSVLALAHLSGTSPSKLLLPMALATMVGGTASAFTTTNVVSSGILQSAGYTGYGVVDFWPLGMSMAVVAIVYNMLIGVRLMPETKPSSHGRSLTRHDHAETYKLSERLIQAEIVPGSALEGKTIEKSGIRSEYKMTIVAIERRGKALRLPPIGTRLRSEDILLLEGRYQELDWNALEPTLKILPERPLPLAALESDKIHIAEATLAPRSSLIGQTLVDCRFGDRYGVQVLGIWRGGQPIRSELGTRKIQMGDGLLLYGPRDKILQLREDHDLIMLSDPMIEEAPARHRSGLALGIFLTAIIGTILFTEHLSLILLTGAIAMIVSGVLSKKAAYQAIEWRVIFLVAGMLPLGLAITKTGLADRIIGLVLPVAERFGPYAAFIVLFVITILFCQFIHSAVVATIMVPLAIRLAQETGMDPRSIVIGIANATSLTLMTPLGHPVAMLVMAPGGYKFKDYLRIGVPLTILLSVMLLTLLPIFWPLY